MKRSKSVAEKSILAVLIIALPMMLVGCAEQTVSALDYSLENVLYTEEKPEGTGETPTGATAEPTVNAATDTPEPEATPSADLTSFKATPTPDPVEESGDRNNADATAEPTAYRYTVSILDKSGTPLSGVRTTVYRDGELLYSNLSPETGSVSWMLPVGSAYFAHATLDGYRQIDNGSSISALDQDRNVTIVLAVSVEDENGILEPTPLPVPSAAEGKVTITAEDITIRVGQTSFPLKNGVSAKTEFDQTVPVWVVNNGGFQADHAGVYTVTYGALENGELITATRTVTVQGDTVLEDSTNAQVSAPTGSSKERYEILLAYRDDVYDDLSAKIAQLNAEYQKKVTETAGSADARILSEANAENDTDEWTGGTKEVQQISSAIVTNWSDVLATFLARYTPDEQHPLDVSSLLSIPLDQLDGVFWDMNQIEVYRIGGQDDVLLTAKTYEDMADAYHMSDQRRSFLYELMQPEFQSTFASLTGSAAFAPTTDDGVEEALNTLPDDVDVERKVVVETALSLVGKIKYVWGGKYNSLGWSSSWGDANEDTVTSIGSVSSHSTTKGLDCSGFVSWTFINATGDPAILSAIGNGSNNQWKRSVPIGWDEGRPGDLIFFYAPGEMRINHVGIIVSADTDGSYLVAHCSSRQHGVVVTDAWSTGFRYIRRPAFFQ